MRRVISKYHADRCSAEQKAFLKALLGRLQQSPSGIPDVTSYRAMIGGTTFEIRKADNPQARRHLQRYEQVVFVDGKQIKGVWEPSVSKALGDLILAGRISDPRFPSSGPPPPPDFATPVAPVRKVDGVRVEDDHVMVHGVRLDRYPEPGPLTPTANEVGELLGVDQELKVIAAAIARRMPILLVGDSGTGKTTILMYLAHLCNANLLKVVGDPEYGPSLWIGHLHAQNGSTYWVDGDLPTAMKGIDNGGQTWLFVDELSRMLPDNTAPLFPILERRGGHLGPLRLTDQPDEDKRIVSPHPDFRIVMAMNPFDGDFAGTHEVDLALLRRVGASLEMKYPEPDVQKAILKKRFPHAGGHVVKTVNAATAIREDRLQRRLSFACSPDVLENWLELTPLIGFRVAADVAIVNKAAAQDKPRLTEIINEKLR